MGLRVFYKTTDSNVYLKAGLQCSLNKTSLKPSKNTCLPGYSDVFVTELVSVWVLTCSEDFDAE